MIETCLHGVKSVQTSTRCHYPHDKFDLCANMTIAPSVEVHSADARKSD
ncbi:MAG: hypothetical protein ACNA7M_12450 [Roseovarius sp.]